MGLAVRPQVFKYLHSVASENKCLLVQIFINEKFVRLYVRHYAECFTFVSFNSHDYLVSIMYL